MSNPLVVMRDLTKVYRQGNNEVVALDRVGLEIASGEFLALMGPSGSGKSTLLHLMAGIDRPSQGVCLVQGIDLSTLREAELARWRQEHVGLKQSVVEGLRTSE